MIKDLSEGRPYSLLWRFALPMLGSAAFQQLYNIVDSIVAGKFVGDNALAAVGASYPVTMIYTAVAMGINIGCSVVISQYFGAKRYGDTKTAVSTSLLASSALCLLMMIAGIILCEPLLNALNTPGDILNDSALYLRIYTGGLMFVFIYNICTGTFTALGDSATPFKFLVASSIGNIIMDCLFVIVFKMGVAGVAWATFLCQGVASVLAFIVLMRRLGQMPSEGFSKFSFPVFKRVVKLAVPGIIQQSFISIGNLLIQRVVNGYGSTVIAGYSAAVKLNSFGITLFCTLSNAVSNFSAQNIGAGKLGRVHEGVRASIIIGAMIVVPFFLFYFFFGEYAMRIFVKSDSADVIAVGARYLQILAPFYFLTQLKVIGDGVLHGSAAVALFMITTFTDLILRVVLAYILPSFFSYTGIWLAWPVGWVISCAITWCFYFSRKWERVTL